jgi:hypothetical protein
MVAFFLVTFSGENGGVVYSGCASVPDGVEDTDVPIGLFDSLRAANKFARAYFEAVAPLSTTDARKKSPDSDDGDDGDGYVTLSKTEGRVKIHGQDTEKFHYYVNVERVEVEAGKRRRYYYVVVDVEHYYNGREWEGGDEENVLLGVFGSLGVAKGYARGFLRGRDYMGVKEPKAVVKQRAVGLTTRIKPLVQKGEDLERGDKMDEESDEDDKDGDDDSDDENRSDGSTARWVDIVKLELNSTRTA